MMISLGNRNRLRGTNTKLFDLAKQLEKDASEGRLGLQNHGANSKELTQKMVRHEM